MVLSKLHREILHNQYLILQALYPKDKSNAQKADAIYNGYSREYENWMKEMPEETPLELCGEVIDILDMYRMIGNAVPKEGDAGINPDHTVFQGFDGNEEGDHYSYAKFVLDSGKFREANGGPNSHTPTLPKYRDMLQAWRAMEDRHNLSLEQAMELIAMAPRRF